MSIFKPKLFLFSHICSPVSVTGAEKLLLLFTRELMQHYQCVLIVPQPGVIAEKAKALGVRVIVMDIPLCISLYTAAPSVWEEIEEMKKHPSWVKLQALLTEERPAFVLANTSVHPLPAAAAKALGVPTIWMIMETIMDTPERSAAISFISANSDRIVGISHSTLQPFYEHIDVHSTFLLSPYLDAEELLPSSWAIYRLRSRQQYGWSEYHRVAGYLAATIYPNKGLEPFIQGMLPIAASNPRARFLIIGNPAEDGYYQACQSLVEQSGYADRFVFEPYIEKIQLMYPVLDVVVVPSLAAEGFGMTALEGLVFGKGVVAFASGGLSEIMMATGNETFLTDTGDTAGLTGRVNVLLANDVLLKNVGDRNAQMAKQIYGIETFRIRLEELVNSLPQPSILHNGLWRGSGPTVYLVEAKVRRAFASEQAMLGRGHSFDDVKLTTDEQLLLLPEGPPLLQQEEDRPIKRRSRKARSSRKRRLRSRTRRRSGLRSVSESGAGSGDGRRRKSITRVQSKSTRIRSLRSRRLSRARTKAR